MDDDSRTTEQRGDRRGDGEKGRGRSDTRSLRRSVLLPFALGALLLGMTVGTLAALATREAAHEELDDRAASVRNIVDDALERGETELRDDVTLLAERDPGALGPGIDDRVRLRRLAERLKAKDRIDRVTLAGRGGSEPVTGGGVRWGRLPGAGRLARSARAGLVSSGLAISSNGEPVQFAAAPLPGGREALVVERALDREKVEDIARPLDAVLVVTTSTPGAREHTRGAVPESSRFLRTYTYPLKIDRGGQGSAHLTVALSTEPLARATRDTIVRAGLAGVAIALFLILFVGQLLDRAVLRPLERLRAGIGRVKGGDYRVRLQRRGARELREVSDGFNRMVGMVDDQRTRLEALAATDPLTGLANHRGFHETLDIELRRAQRQQGVLALVAIDLDHFKAINDAHGHPYGDDVLRMVGNALRGSVRGTDLVARIGGEEFAMILPGADSELARRVAERARAAVAEVEVLAFKLTCSAGIALYPTDAHDGATLLQLADGALYSAKRAGRDQTQGYDPRHVPTRFTDEQRQQVKSLLEKADSIQPVFQPLVDLATGRVAGYEALARVPDARGRAPESLFDQAHRCGLGPDLEAEAIRAALDRPGRPAGTFLSLNVSPSAVASPQLEEVLPRDLNEVVIEITEHELATHGDSLEVSLKALRARGARIALDDAGSGYAGLQLVMRAEPDIIKLDRELVHGVHDDLAKVALIESFVRFARRTGAVVCAEGIERLEDLAVLADLDVTYGQGYVLARPAPPWAGVDPEVAERLLRRSVESHPELTDAAGGEDTGDRRLEQVSAQLSKVGSLDDLAPVVELIGAELRADSVSLSEWNAYEGYVETLIPGRDGPDGQRYLLKDHPTTLHALTSQEAVQVLVSDPLSDPAEVAVLKVEGYRSLLMVPIISRGRSVGLFVAYSYEERPWGRTEMHRARIIGYQLGTVLEDFGRHEDGHLERAAGRASAV
jgi:diguanylate cyclase (GGDEF)-like protein